MHAAFDFDLFGEPLPQPKPRKKRELSPRDHLLQLRIFWMRNPELRTPAPAPERKREKVVLIGCGKAKRKTATKARDLYTSTIFRARVAAAEASGCRWFIVSALHGLLDPETVVEPYEKRLADDAPKGGMFQPHKRNAIEAWGRGVVEQLRALDSDLELELHMGADYRHGITSARVGFIRTWNAPTAGLDIFQQNAWYKAQRAA